MTQESKPVSPEEIAELKELAQEAVERRDARASTNEGDPADVEDLVAEVQDDDRHGGSA
jgi:hypothetical protein